VAFFALGCLAVRADSVCDRPRPVTGGVAVRAGTARRALCTFEDELATAVAEIVGALVHCADGLVTALAVTALDADARHRGFPSLSNLGG